MNSILTENRRLKEQLSFKKVEMAYMCFLSFTGGVLALAVGQLLV